MALIELKSNQETKFEWQRYSQDKPDVPPVDKLLKFLDLRAQAVESSTHESIKHTVKSKVFHVSNVASTDSTKLAEASCSKPA